MTNLEKMNQLVGTNSNKEIIMDWAYMNRVFLFDLPYRNEFTSMKASVDNFIKEGHYTGEETKNWNKFLDLEYVEEVNVNAT